MIRKYLNARVKSFGYAFHGIRTLIETQPHARIHLISTLIVLIGGFYLKLQKTEWFAILICIGMVWMAEALNTAIEFLGDEVSLEQRDRIGKAKDIAAAGVLIVSIISAVVALLILNDHVSLNR